MTTHYLLARHVFVCVQGEHVVFLDVRKDRYFALESARTAGLGRVVPGWPVPAPLGVDFARQSGHCTAAALSEQVNQATLSGVTSLLLEKGILVSDPTEGKRADMTIAEPVHGDLAAEAFDTRARVRPRVLLRFAASAIRARLLLNHRTFEAVIARARCRAQQGRQLHHTSITQAELHELINSFSSLQPFFFEARNACLFNALSLSEFLAAYGVFPHWVFGVQSRPFAAHCWLQLDGVVLNDTIDHIKRYTPIMVV